MGARASAWDGVISADGRWVAFASDARNFTSASPGSSNDENVFAKNTATGALELVSVGVGGALANGNSGAPSVSGDGRYVAFESLAGNLVASDANGTTDIFVRDLVTSSTRRVSLGTGGVEANSSSSSPSISGDGRYVAFESLAGNLVAGDTNGRQDIYVRDLSTGTTTRASLGVGGAEVNEKCLAPSISADGRYVAFDSPASNLVAGDTNNVRDIYVRDLVTGSTIRASVGPGGAQANRDCTGASISADGRYVAFQTEASTLAAGDTNGRKDIYVRDLSAGTTLWVSLGPGGAQANAECLAPWMSGNGRYVTFESFASNLVAGDTNNARDIFVQDLTTGTTVRTSLGAGGAQANAESLAPSLSADGRSVEFQSTAGNLAAGDTQNSLDIFLRNLSTGVTTRSSLGPDGEEGRTIAFIYGLDLSADGNHVAIDTNAYNLVSGDTNEMRDIFVRNLSTGAVARAPAGALGAPDKIYFNAPSISADGRYVAFESDVSDLVPGDTNGYQDIFVRDFSTGVTTRVSVASNGAQANSVSRGPSISANGRYVAFISYATNLAGGVQGGSAVFVRDLSTGVTTRASQGSEASISANGRYVAFMAGYNIFVQDLVMGTTTQASLGVDGAQPDRDSYHPQISADGRYVAFYSYASNLVDGDTNERSDIFVRDLPTGITTRANVGADGTQANDWNVLFSLSADGRFVAFQSVVSNLVPGDTNNTQDIFVRDLLEETTTRVSVSSSGAQANAFCLNPSISADGRVVAYISRATNLTDDVTYDLYNVFVTTLPAPPPPPPPAPGAPTNLTALAITSRRVNLAWTEHTNNETGFEIWTSVDGGPFFRAATIPANQTTYQHLGPDGSHTIYYKVRALTADSQTEFSNIASAILMAQPLGLGARALNGVTIDVRWQDNATNEASYELWRAVGGGAFTLLATKRPGASQHTDTVPAGNQTYTYKVWCKNGPHLSSFSNENRASVMLAPTNLAANAASSTQVKLNWTDNSGALETGFQVYRRTSATGSQTLLGTTAANATSFTDPAALPGRTYWYEVRAATGKDSSNFSNQVTVSTLRAPTALVAKALNSTSVDLRWTDNATNESNYEIWRSVGGGAFTLRYTTPFANATQYTDTVPAGDTVYTYQVRARSGANYSDYSKQDGATTLLAPTNLNGTPVSSTRVDLTWTDNSTRETGFQVSRRSSTDASWVLIATLGANSTSYSDQTAQGGTAYSYLVRAVVGDNGSSYTNTVQVTTP